jgi:Zn-dependent metalloprotease
MEGGDLGGGDDVGPTTLVTSADYIRTADHEDVQARLDELQAAIDDLRDTTGSGWVGRQDDITGYLAELSGGRYFGAQDATSPEVIGSFLESYGSRLFGIGAADITLGAETAVTGVGSTSIRGEQEVDGVPVLDAVLTFTIGAADDEPRLSAVRGRVYPGLTVDTTPQVGADRARRLAARLSGGSVQGDPRLVVMPGGPGQLAWELAVVGVTESGTQVTPADGLYYLDASTGDVITVRPSSAEVAPLVPHGASYGSPRSAIGRVHGTAPTIARLPHGLRAADSASVDVTGAGPNGESLTAHGVRTQRGVLLKDTTVPTYDAATGEGGIQVFDAGGSDDESQLPGTPYVQSGSGTTITDPDAIAAQAYSRAVYDYYDETYGRQSWDGAGASMVSTVNVGGGDFCNAFFNSSLRQMIYGNPCQGPGGEGQLVTVDVTGHEITHGVTGSTAGLLYVGQSGALNESFSDYFGNVIGNRFKGTDDATLGEDLCAGVTQPQTLCDPTSEGVLATRDMLNGAKFSGYLRLLNPGLRLQLLRSLNQDHGGVHLNSAIWNNALWSIRARLAQIDQVPGNDSPLAQSFDHAVFNALTTQLGPTAGFLDARAAVEQSITDLGADPTVLQVAQEVFDFDEICSDCGDTAGATPALGVGTGAQSQVNPAVHGDRVAWVDLNADGFFGTRATASFDGSGAETGPAPDTAQVVFAGDALVSLDGDGNVVRDAADGTTTLAQEDVYETAARGLAGSDDGAAWVSYSDNAVKYVDDAGTVTTGSLDGLGNDPVLSVATGGGSVAMGTDGGRVLAWTPGGDVTSVGQMDQAVLSIAAYGDRILAVDEAGNVALFDTTGGRTDITDQGTPFGAAMNDHYAVWSNSVGTLGGDVADELGVSAPDTDLYLYSFDTGTIYDLVPTAGQQGFPALSGDRIVWQDSVFDGDDILTATIPSDL